MIGNLGEFGSPHLPKGDLKIEPWMTEFVKGRHTQEEWDAFFVYCEAGPFKRWLSRVGSFFYYILLGDR